MLVVVISFLGAIVWNLLAEVFFESALVVAVGVVVYDDRGQIRCCVEINWSSLRWCSLNIKYF